MLGSEVDEKVQAYIRYVREGGGSISSRLVIAGAKGILLSLNCSLYSGVWRPSYTHSSLGPLFVNEDDFCEKEGHNC